MIPVKFIGPAYTMDSLDISAQKCVNMYLEAYLDSGAKVQMSLRPTHGLLSFASLNGAQQIRGLYLASTGAFFAVMGTQVQTVSTAGTPTNQFNLSTGSAPGSATIVRFADTAASANRTTVNSGETALLIADGTTNAYTYNISTDVATQITDSAYPGGSFCGILDGYYIVNKPDTLFAYYSDLEEPTSWNTTQTLTKESTTDNINGLIVNDGKVWLFGTLGYEIHRHTGQSTNRFLRIAGTSREIGLHAPDSLKSDGTSVYWVGGSATGFGKIYRSQGFEAVPISTIPMERAIHGYSTTTDAEGLTFQQDGHSFYQVTFPSENKTWVYDASVSAILGQPVWHEKLYRNPNTSVDERHRARVAAFFNNKNYFGDWATNDVYSAEQTTYTDNTQTIIRNRTSPTTWNARERIFYKTFELDIERGVGLATGQGSAPLVMIRWSDDSGHTWSNKYQMDVGAIGEYGPRVKRERLGQARERVWEITYSEPTKFNLMGAFVD